MNFDPPQIYNIKEILPVIADNPAFIVMDKGWFKVIDYVYMSDKMFQHPLERECRGLKFDAKTGDIIARPYHKFHNLNERDGYRTEQVDLSQPHVILDKLDGSMVHTCPSSLGMYLMTRKGLSEVALAADKFLERHSVRYSQLFDALGWTDYTYIFEYVGPNNKIVLDYAEENLILTAIRHVTNGTYVFHDEMVKLADAFGIPVVGLYAFKSPYGDDMAAQVKNDTETEGVVVRFDTGFMVKIKADAYVLKHRSKDLVSSQKGVLELISNNQIDDILPQLDDKVRDKLEEYELQCLRVIGALCSGLLNYVQTMSDVSQKEFALSIAHMSKVKQSCLFSIRKGDDPCDTVMKRIRDSLSNKERMTQTMEGFGLPAWNFSFFGEE